MTNEELKKKYKLDFSEIAKLLGGIKTAKKAKSSRENGKKGGRPRKDKNERAD